LIGISGNFIVISWTFRGHVLECLRKLPGHFLEFSYKILRNVLDNFLEFSLTFPRYFLYTFMIFSGTFPEMSKKLNGNDMICVAGSRGSHRCPTGDVFPPERVHKQPYKVNKIKPEIISFPCRFFLTVPSSRTWMRPASCRLGSALQKHRVRHHSTPQRLRSPKARTPLRSSPRAKDVDAEDVDAEDTEDLAPSCIDFF